MFLQTRVCLKLLHQGECTRNFRSEFGSCTNSDNVPITCKDQSLGSQHPSFCLLSCLHCICTCIVRCRWHFCPVLALAPARQLQRQVDAGAGHPTGIRCQPQVPQQKEQAATKDAQVPGRQPHCAGSHHLPCAGWNLHGDGGRRPHSIHLRYIYFTSSVHHCFYFKIHGTMFSHLKTNTVIVNYFIIQE